MHHTDISRQNLNCSLMNRRSATDGGGGGRRGPQNDFSLPCNILPKQMISKQKKSLPHYIFLIETQCIAASEGTIIVARGVLS